MTVLAFARPRGEQHAAPHQALRTSVLFRDAVRERLRFAFLAACAGQKVSLPVVERPNGSMSGRKVERHLIEHCQDALDHMTTAQVFADVLEHSQCPRVAELRVAMADSYARGNADDVAAVERDL